mgnify:CR=1 FL=1
MPKYLDVVESLPTLTSGKVDRKQLPAPIEVLKGSDRQYVAPAGDLELAVAEAWEACFHTSPVSAEDDFFLDLGGHSLLAAQVVTELRAALGTSRISVRDIYKHRTVRALAARLRDLEVCIGATAEKSDETAPTASELAFAKVPVWERRLCVGLQAVSAMVIYGLLAAPVAYAVLMTYGVMTGGIDIIIFMTGVGIRHLMAEVERHVDRQRLLAAMVAQPQQRAASRCSSAW